jgi:hypothetical protein
MTVGGGARRERPIDERLAFLEERQNELKVRLRDAMWGIETIRVDLRALDGDMRALGVDIALRVAEDKLGR